MAAISKARHYKLTDDITRLSYSAISSDDLIIDLNEATFQLQQLYESYSAKLSEVQNLIKEYEITQRRIKINLRKQQIKRLKQKLTS